MSMQDDPNPRRNALASLLQRFFLAGSRTPEEQMARVQAQHAAAGFGEGPGEPEGDGDIDDRGLFLGGRSGAFPPVPTPRPNPQSKIHLGPIPTPSPRPNSPPRPDAWPGATSSGWPVRPRNRGEY